MLFILKLQVQSSVWKKRGLSQHLLILEMKKVRRSTIWGLWVQTSPQKLVWWALQGKPCPKAFPGDGRE